MTLVELLVYIVLSSIVILVMTSLVVSVSRTTSRMNATSESSNTAQMLLNHLQINLRNATAITAVPSDEDLLIVAEVRSNEGGVENAENTRCVGYFFDQSEAEVRAVTIQDITDPTTRSAVTNVNAALAWPHLAEGVTRRGALPVVEVQGPSVIVNFNAQVSSVADPVVFESQFAISPSTVAINGCA